MNSPNEERDPQLAETAPEQPQPPANMPPPVGPAPWTGATSPPLAVPPTGPPPTAEAANRQWTNRLRDPRRKSSALAILMSMMPGLGQIYVGHYKRGFVHILIIASLITLLAEDMGPLTPLAGLGLAFFWLYNMVDAGRRATHYNQMIDAQAGGTFPEDIDFPSTGGSRAGGAVLMVLGLIFLMHTRFDWQFYWIEEWWPLGFMLLGGYLIYKDRQSRKSDD
jgi:hypothetical protein